LVVFEKAAFFRLGREEPESVALGIDSSGDKCRAAAGGAVGEEGGRGEKEQDFHGRAIASLGGCDKFPMASLPWAADLV
jgi:hypothetical protein